MQFECGAGSRWNSTREDSSGETCNFSGCNCGTKVRMVRKTTDIDAASAWFGLRVAQHTPEVKALMEGALRAEEQFSPDELEAFADSIRK